MCKYAHTKDDMEVDIEEDANEPELTYPYKEVDHLNPPPPASESEPEDMNEVENTIEHEDKTVPASVHEVAESSTASFLREDSDGLLPSLMRRDINSLFAKDEYYGKLILDLGNEVRSSVEQGTTAMEKLVEKLGNTEVKVECKKLKKELEETRFSNIFLRMQNERVERDLYWTRVRAHEFYQEMIRRGFVFEERSNEAINVPVKDEELSRLDANGCNDLYHFMKQCNYESVDAAIAAKRTRQANARNDARGFGSVMGQDAAPAVHECTFAGFMKCNPITFHGCNHGFGDYELNALDGDETVDDYRRFNELALMCLRMVEPERVKVDAYIRGLTDNIKGEVTSSRPANLNEAVCMAHKLMELKS
ncbi:hypothetical protein Tco_1360239 [Tanacetum coccineum]